MIPPCLPLNHVSAHTWIPPRFVTWALRPFSLPRHTNVLCCCYVDLARLVTERHSSTAFLDLPFYLLAPRHFRLGFIFPCKGHFLSSHEEAISQPQLVMLSGWSTAKGRAFYVLTIIFQLIALIAVALRIWAKSIRKRPFAPHDYLIFAASVCRRLAYQQQQLFDCLC